MSDTENPTSSGSALGDLLTDEKGNLSTHRLLLLLWTLSCVGLLWFKLALLSPAVLAFLSVIEGYLICATGGPRIAEYLAPQLGKVLESISKAIWERRDPAGIEPKP